MTFRFFKNTFYYFLFVQTCGLFFVVFAYGAPPQWEHSQCVIKSDNLVFGRKVSPVFDDRVIYYIDSHLSENMRQSNLHPNMGEVTQDQINMLIAEVAEVWNAESRSVPFVFGGIVDSEQDYVKKCNASNYHSAFITYSSSCKNFSNNACPGFAIGTAHGLSRGCAVKSKHQRFLP